MENHLLAEALVMEITIAPPLPVREGGALPGSCCLSVGDLVQHRLCWWCIWLQLSDVFHPGCIILFFLGPGCCSAVLRAAWHWVSVGHCEQSEHPSEGRAWPRSPSGLEEVLAAAATPQTCIECLLSPGDQKSPVKKQPPKSCL